MKKKYDTGTFSHFATVHTCDRQADRQTDMAHSALVTMPCFTCVFSAVFAPACLSHILLTRRYAQADMSMFDVNLGIFVSVRMHNLGECRDTLMPLFLEVRDSAFFGFSKTVTIKVKDE